MTQTGAAAQHFRLTVNKALILEVKKTYFNDGLELYNALVHGLAVLQAVAPNADNEALEQVRSRLNQEAVLPDREVKKLPEQKISIKIARQSRLRSRKAKLEKHQSQFLLIKQML